MELDVKVSFKFVEGNWKNDDYLKIEVYFKLPGDEYDNYTAKNIDIVDIESIPRIIENETKIEKMVIKMVSDKIKSMSKQQRREQILAMVKNKKLTLKIKI